jgi:hypothetical protein
MANYRTLDTQGHQKGKFIPKNPTKYKGKLPIIFRSSWELAFMRMCDLTAGIESWGSESIVVEYIDNTVPAAPKRRRYFVDFNMTVKTTSGKLMKYLVEIKPHVQTIPPLAPKPVNGIINERARASYALALQTYQRNMLKWTAAKIAAKSKGFQFMVLTEKNLFKK